MEGAGFSCFPWQTSGSDHLPPSLASWPCISTQNPLWADPQRARQQERAGGHSGLCLPPTPPQPAPARPPSLLACTPLLLPVDLCWEKIPSPSLPPPLHAALSPCPSPLPLSVLSHCLVRNLFASEAISPCFVYTTALVVFGFCYCRETQILYTLCKIYAKPQLSISYSPCSPCTVAGY